MAKKETRRVRTLGGFIKWAEQFEPGQYLFRGVSNDTYTIKSSTSVRLRENDSNPAKILKINEEMIKDARLHGHDAKSGQRLSDLELLAELQHYGAATFLIDFTYSAQVALWMACRKNPEGHVNGKVFAVRSDDPVRFKKITPELLEENLAYFFQPDERRGYPLYQWQPKQHNNRIIAQQSVFLFGGAQVEAEAECIILKGSKPDLQTSLARVSGITEAKLFPDFYGFANLRAYHKLYVEPDVRDYMLRGIEAILMDNFDDVIAYYSEVISSQRADLPLDSFYSSRGRAYEKRGEYDLAIADYTIAVELDPKDAERYISRGITYGLKGDFDNAIKDFNKAINLNSNDFHAYNHRGIVYKRKGENNKAIDDFSKAIELNPDDDYGGPYFNRGIIYHNEGEVEKAIDDYSKSIELNPSHANAYYYRGTLWLRLQNWERAKVDLTDARNRELNTIAEFFKDYGSIVDFEMKNNVSLPGDIKTMLTQN